MVPALFHSLHRFVLAGLTGREGRFAGKQLATESTKGAKEKPRKGEEKEERAVASCRAGGPGRIPL